MELSKGEMVIGAFILLAMALGMILYEIDREQRMEALRIEKADAALEFKGVTTKHINIARERFSKHSGRLDSLEHKVDKHANEFIELDRYLRAKLENNEG